MLSKLEILETFVCELKEEHSYQENKITKEKQEIMSAGEYRLFIQLSAC